MISSMVREIEQELEEHLRLVRDESRRARRKVEKVGGVVLMAASLVCALVFLFVLKVGKQNPPAVAASLFFLTVAVVLFGRGVRDALLGK